MTKEKTPQQLAKLTENGLHRYFSRKSRFLRQAKIDPYFVQVGTVTVWAKSPKSLFSKFKAELRRQAKAPLKVKRDREIVCQLFLPVRKVGEALRGHLIPEKGRRPKLHVALDRFAADLSEAFTVVRALSAYLADKQGVRVDADTTVIQFTGPESVLKPLVKEKMLWLDKSGTADLKR